MVPSDYNKIETTAALFVDFENLYYVLRDEPWFLREQEAISASLEVLNVLKEELYKKGWTLILERSYADFEPLPPALLHQLQLAGITPRYVHARKGKNSADIELSLDMQKTILCSQNIQAMVLVGGDRDYLPILRRIKEANKHVLIASFKQSFAADIKELARHYRHAEIRELDQLINPMHFRTRAEIITRPSEENTQLELGIQTNGEIQITDGSNQTDLNALVQATYQPRETYDPEQNYDWEERYLSAMLRFLEQHDYGEVHLGPFFRWVQGQPEVDLMSVRDQRRTF